MINKLQPNIDYLLLIKIKFGQDQTSMYKMAGKQVTFRLSNDYSELTLAKLYDSVLHRVRRLMEKYIILDKEMVWVQLIFTKLNSRILSDIKSNEVLDLNYFKPQGINTKDIVYFSMSTQADLLGHTLSVRFSNQEIFVFYSSYFTIKVNFNEIKLNYSPDSIVSNKYSVFYLRDMIKPHYILVILEKDNFIFREAYDLLGNLISKVKDEKLVGGRYIRHYDNSIIKFNVSLELESIERNIPIQPIKTFVAKTNKVSLMENQKIGVIDLEVAVNSVTDKPFVYSAGLYTYIDNSPKIFYINNHLDYKLIILDLIKEMFSYKYKGITFYCHNFG